jgi:hypothetical protein
MGKQFGPKCSSRTGMHILLTKDYTYVHTYIRIGDHDQGD